MPERDETRINERIRVPQVRLVGEDGNQIGVVDTQQALRYAQERDLDLVEVAPEARPPVCRVLDYSKYKYEQEQKAKAARRHQKQVNVREIKLRPKIATNDYETKKNHVVRFLKGDDRVKVTIMFRGREQTHPERGERLLMRLAEDVADLGTVEQSPQQDGRNMTMLLAPSKKKAEHEEQPAASDARSPPPPRRRSQLRRTASRRLPRSSRPRRSRLPRPRPPSPRSERGSRPRRSRAGRPPCTRRPSASRPFAPEPARRTPARA